MPTINKGSDYFGVLTYTGDGAASKTVVDTNAVSFTPDFVWIKGRSGATDHALYDAVRGTTKDLVSNSTAAETTQSTGLTAFTNGGFTIGNLAKLNTSGATYVAWCWKANGAGSSNTSGSITSTVSVNTTAGCSVVTYISNATAGATIGHGLGVAPSFVIARLRNQTASWSVYHKSLGASQYILLNSTNAAVSSTQEWGGVAPTSSVVTIGNSSANNNAISGSTAVAYCWAEIAGFSKFGSFVGNSSTNGPFVYCGFRPRYILFKNTTNYDWHVFDAARNTYNYTNSSLKPDTSGAEYTNNDVSVDLLSNGFKLTGTDLAINGPSNTIIFAAFAEHPFKNANAR